MDYVVPDISPEAAERRSVFGAVESVFNSILPMLKKQAENVKRVSVEQYLCIDTHRKDPVDRLEDFHSLYKDSIRQMHKIRPHADPDYFPRELFENLSPHRKSEEADWIKNNYECVTLPVWMDFQDTIKRGVNVNNYKIAWPEDWPTEYEEEELSPRVYLEDGLKLFQSVHAWFSNQLFDVKLKDPNGVIAVQPYKTSPVVNDDGDVVMGDAMVEPIPVYYSCDRVLAFEEDEYYLLLSEERSVVDFGGAGKKIGHVLYWFDKENIIRIEQVGKYTDWTFMSYVYIEHAWNAVPVWKLKGQPKMKGKHLYFQSPFFFAVGNLNLALKNQINKQMAEANSAWPHKVMIADRCDYEHDGWACEDGRLMKGGEIANACPKCRGRGVKDKPSPGSTMMVDEEGLKDNGIGLDRIRFISPEAGILDHLENTIKKNMTEGRSMLHLYTTDGVATGQDQTATGEVMDRNSMYAFMRPILDEGFDILEGVMNSALYMRYGDSIGEVKVIRPTDLDYKTSADYLAEYTSLLEKGAPPIVLYKVLEKYIQSMFYASGDDRKIWKLVLAVDTVAAKKDEEIRNMIGAGTLPKWKAVLHNGIFSYISELMGENDKFLDLEFDEQKALLVEKAKTEADEIKGASEINTDPLNGIFQNRQTPSGQNGPAGPGASGTNRPGIQTPTAATQRDTNPAGGV